MALNVAYFIRADAMTHKVYGACIGGAAVTLGASSATIGTIPNGTSFARFSAGEDCIISNNDQAASSTNGVPLRSGEIIDLEVPVGGVYYAKTA